MSHHGRDAWIFLSIGDAGGLERWASLADVIGAADANNHLIPNIGELEGGVSRLRAAGLVETKGTRTRLTAAGVRTHAAAHEPDNGHIERMLRLGEAWEQQGYPPEAPLSWSISEAEFNKAWGEYHAWAQQAIARIGHRADGA